jgi:hypothetical protein
MTKTRGAKKGKIPKSSPAAMEMVRYEYTRKDGTKASQLRARHKQFPEARSRGRKRKQ